ncbi:3'-5' exonuclease [Nocardioides dilutus]
MRAWLPFRRHRRRDPGHYPAGPLRELAAAAPSGDATAVAGVEFLALDVETTGLDPRIDHLLSVGWVPVIGREIVLAEAQELTVRPPGEVDVGASATFHRLTDDQLADATPLPDVLPRLLDALHGRVLLAHHAQLELGFLAEATLAAYGARPPVTAVDTLALQQRLLPAHHRAAGGSLRLDAVRRAYGLPRYTAHHALTDALAAAELFLAQVAELERRLGRDALLRDLSPKRSG